MTVRMNKKIFAIIMVILLILSGSIGYILISKDKILSIDNSNTRHTNTDQNTIKTTQESNPTPKVDIQAGPLVGYGPLTVHFYANPENESNIASYHWDFSPKTRPIIPQSQYKPVHFSIILFFLFNFAYVLLYSLISTYRYRTNSQYESTEQNPTMVFLHTGTYSATLTITDKQDQTSTDIVWITVLQYVHPDF